MIVANQSKSIIFFSQPLLKTIISRAIFKGPKFKLIFMLYKNYTLSKVLCTCHCICCSWRYYCKVTNQMTLSVPYELCGRVSIRCLAQWLHDFAFPCYTRVNTLMNKHLSFQRALNPHTLLLCLSNIQETLRI